MRFRHGVSTVTLAITTVLPLAGTALADGSQGPGLLTATDYSTGTAEMVALNPVSGSLTTVYATRAEDGVLSPDGTQVAYVRSEDTCIPQPEGCTYAKDLVVAGADGSNPHIVVAGIQPETNDAPYVAHPHWSPDGRRIVFDSPRGMEWVDTDGTGEQTLTSLGMRGTFSPDGRSLAFLRTTQYQAADGSWQYGTDVYVMATTTLEVRQLTTSGDVWATAADWSPDGTRLVYTSDHGAHTVDVATGGVTDLNSGWTTPLSAVRNAVHSPDGTKIAFEGHDDLTSGNATYVMNAADGGGLHQLTDGPVLLTDWHTE